MSGLQGQSRAPTAPVRERRNFDNLSEVVEFISPNEPIQLNGDGAFSLELIAAGGLQTISAELGIKLDTDPGLTLSTDGLTVVVQGVIGLDASGLKVNVGSGLENASGNLALALAADPGLEFELGDLRVKVGDGLTRDSTGIRLGLGTTKGDMVVYNGSSYVRVGVGTDDQVMTADSSEAAGVAWKDAGGGGGGSGLLDRSTTEQDAGFNTRDDRDVYEKTIDFGALPNNATKDVAHSIGSLNVPGFLELEAWASDGSTTRPLPWSDGTNIISLEVDTANISITSNFDASEFASCEVFMRYTRNLDGTASFVEASSVTYGAGDSIASISQTVPATSASGDMVVAVLMHRAGASGITAPSGFTRVAQQKVGGTIADQWGELWAKEDDGTLGGTSISFSGDLSGRMGLVVLVIRPSSGHAISVDVSDAGTYVATVNPGIETTPSVSVTNDGRVLLAVATCVYGENTGDTGYSFPSGEGWTQHTPTTSPASPSHERNRLCVATKAADFGPTGTADVEHATSDHAAAMLAVAFKSS